MSTDEIIDMLQRLFFDEEGKLRLPDDIEGNKIQAQRLMADLATAAKRIRPMPHQRYTLDSITDLNHAVHFYYTGLAKLYFNGDAESFRAREGVRRFVGTFEHTIAEIKNFFEARYEESNYEQPAKSDQPFSPEADDPGLHLTIDAGTAPPEEIAELLAELSRIYRKAGGSGINFRFDDATVKMEVLA